jgi:hypothetical protein
LSRPTEHSPAALAQIDVTLERSQKLFKWGHISEAEYRREHERLTLLKEEIASRSVTEPVLQLDGVADAWRRGDALMRRQLLSTLFDALIVRDGEIIEYVPRSDRAAQVHALINTALDLPAESDVDSTLTVGQLDQRSEQTSVSRSGKGGIRTLEGALHPLPA